MSSYKRNKFSVIILTYNSAAFIDRCLNSIEKNWPKKDKKEILVIDNCSKDKTAETVKKHDGVIFYQKRKNSGFASGINFGIEKSKYKKIIILNPDTEIKKNTINKILKCQNKTKAEIIGGKAKKKNGSTHNTYVRFPNFGTIIFDYTNLRKIVPGDYFHKKHYYLDKGKRKSMEVDAVSGCFMLIDKKIFKKIKNFDENFFMYLEDVDFCMRAKKAGFKIYYCNEAEIFHYGGGSSKNVDRIHHKAWISSRKYYVKKNFSLIENLLLQPILFVDSTIINLRAKRK